MADLAAIREARRQRILQGSQNRMNRVLGQEENDTSGRYNRLIVF